MKKNLKKQEAPAASRPPEKAWQRWMPWVLTAVMALWIISSMRTARNTTEYKIEEFSQIPVLLEGRVQPWDSVAKNSLLTLRGKSTVLLADKPQEEIGFFEMSRLMRQGKIKKMPAMEWLLEAMTRPELADTRPIFRIDNQELLGGSLKLPIERKYFTFNEIRPRFDEVQKEAKRLIDQEVPEQKQTPFEKAVMKLYSGVNTYFRLKNSLRIESVTNFAERIQQGQSAITRGLTAFRLAESNEPHNAEDLQTMVQLYKEYDMLASVAYPLVIPPRSGKAQADWVNIGAALKESLRGGGLPQPVMFYATIADSYGSGVPAQFNRAVDEYRSFLATTFQPELRKGAQENFFNHYAPFIKSISVYLLAFLFGCAFWVNFSPWIRRTAFYLLVLALAVHTSGLLFRMYLEGRPPVTNLYSSAIFVGWGAVILCLILERIWKDGIGGVVAGAIGVVTLIIAHNLSLGGDTMIMLRAVLDTNIWLATHVVVITLGYSSMFVAGFLAMIYILRGVFTRTLFPETARALNRMVYGITCFGTLFSFVGTILGGIWADQSWGRFWGWDPKENGALLIVIWCAVVLHARWGGLIRERGMMAMAIFGNIITSFSWFGVNMLGVGLHSYGFMDKAFQWLKAFDISQLVLIAIALMPLRYWRSFKDLAPKKQKPAAENEGVPGAKPAAA
jgi:ABC-type transport system involved in cytochrome c biogenesis permease subunit